MSRQEQIEQAAKEYLADILDSTTFNVNYEEDNYDAGSLHATIEIAEQAFKAGVKFGINSVWRNPDEEEIEDGNHINIIKNKGGEFLIEIAPWLNNKYQGTYHMQCTFGYAKVMRCARVIDILPE